jgi:uncharacterized ferredoxin-like protein
MPIVFEEQSRKDALLEVARRMLIAARTAPKAGGVDNLLMAIIGKEEISRIAGKMKEFVESKNAQNSFLRDAENILAAAECMVLIGTKIKAFGIQFCGLCGHANCAEKNKFPDEPCAFNTTDLGIAVGSALAAAMDCRVDNRLMYSAGIAANTLKYLGEKVGIIYAIPLSCTGKNPFFDRKWPK